MVDSYQYVSHANRYRDNVCLDQTDQIRIQCMLYFTNLRSDIWVMKNVNILESSRMYQYHRSRSRDLRKRKVPAWFSRFLSKNRKI